MMARKLCTVSLWLIVVSVITSCRCYHINITTNHTATFDGLGGISGGGATSKLLNTYLPKYRSDIYDLLFKPSFGASLHILKVEIGGGAQGTDGTELSHMPTDWYRNLSDLNNHSYEWKLLVEATKRNPDIVLIGLAWSFPGWISNGTQNPFTFPDRLTRYLMAWLDVAQSYNLTIQYLGIWNEPPIKIAEDYAAFTKYFRKALDSSKSYRHIKLIIGDIKGWDITKTMLSDKDFYRSVDVLSSHYPGEVSDPMARNSGKTLWASEDYSSVDNGHGAACLARIINRNFVNGFMTSTIAWNLIASYYKTLPFPSCGLMTANQPWSGHYDLLPPVWVLAHTTQFTKAGWKYLSVGHGSGNLTGGGTYVTYVDANRTQTTIVIETMSHTLSTCVRPKTPPYNITTQNITFRLSGNQVTPLTRLHHWVSHLADDSLKCSMMERSSDVEVVDGVVTLLNVPPNTLITLTSLDTGHKGVPKTPVPASQPFPLQYHDTFDDVGEMQFGDEPNYLSPQIGTFQIAKSFNRTFLMQTTYRPPIEFCGPFKHPWFTKKYAPIALMPYNAGAYKGVSNVTVEVAVGAENGERSGADEGVFVGVFVHGGGCLVTNTHGLFFVMNVSGVCGLFSRLNFTVGNELAKTNCSFQSQSFSTVTISTAGDSVIFYLDEKKIFTASKGKMLGRFLGLGCTGFHQCLYDNLNINGN